MRVCVLGVGVGDQESIFSAPGNIFYKPSAKESFSEQVAKVRNIRKINHLAP